MTQPFTGAVETVGLRLHDYFQRVKKRLMDFTEFQLATVEDLHGRKRYPRGRKKQHEHMGRLMVDECYIQGCTREDALAAKCLRLADELQRRGV